MTTPDLIRHLEGKGYSVCYLGQNKWRVKSARSAPSYFTGDELTELSRLSKAELKRRIVEARREVK